MRDEWLAAVAAHVHQVEEDSGDPLDPAVLDIAQSLAGVLGDDLEALQAWHLLGRFHMHRSSAIYHADQDGWQADNEAMMAAFARCLLAGPGKPDGLDIPGDILDGIAQYASQMTGALASQARQALDAKSLAALPVMWQRIASALPADSPVRPAMLANVGVALLNRFLAAGDVYDLDAAVSVGRQAVATAAGDDPELPALYYDLTRALVFRFEQRGDRADIDGAIASIEQALALFPAGVPAPARYLSFYGGSLRMRFDGWGDPADLDRAVAASQLAVLVADEDDRSSFLPAVASALLRRFDVTADRADLDNAIAAFGQAMDLVPAGSDARPPLLAGVGNALRIRFGLTRNAEDLDEAVAAARQSVAEARDTHPERPLYLDGLGATLVIRAAFGGDPQDADQAVAACREAVAAAGPSHHLRPQLLSNLSSALKARSASPADLEEAITLVRAAVSLVPPGHADRGRFLLGLCTALLDHLLESDDPANADEAVAVGRQMLEAIPPAHANRANALLIFGEALRQRAYLPGAAAGLLDEAVAVFREGVAAMPPGRARVDVIACLGVTLRQRFRQAGDPDDLDGSVAVFREAARQSGALPADGSVLYDLAASLLLRYEREKDADDLGDAVTALRQALTMPATDPEDAPKYQSRLSEALQLAFSLTRRRADIDEAVTLSRQAVEMTPVGHPSLRSYQLALGKALDAQAQSRVTSGSPDRTGSGWAARSELAAHLEALVDMQTSAELPRVLDPAGLADALRLADLIAADEKPDLDSHALLGRYFWLRHHALRADPVRDRRDDDGHVPADSRFFAFSAAIDFYAPVFAAGRWTPHDFQSYVASDIADDALAELFERIAPSGDVNALTEAIGLWRRVLDAIPADHPDRGVYTSALGAALYLRYAAGGVRADLDEGLAMLRDAVPSVPGDHPLLSAFRICLSDALRGTGELDGNAGNRVGVLDAAVAAAREAVGGTTAGTVEHAFARVQLGQALVSRHMATGGTAELDEGIAHLSDATAVIPADVPGSATMARSLSTALYRRFTLAADPAPLDEAISAARRALAATSDRYPELVPTLVVLGVALRDRAELNGSEDDLAEAVDVLTQARQGAVPGSPSYASSLGSLSQALLTRFMLAGQVDDLDAAVDLAREAIATIPSGNADGNGLTTMLGRALLARFEWSGSEADLDAAIVITRQASRAAPRADLGAAEDLRISAMALQMKYLRTDEPRFLDESVETARLALSVIPDGYPNAALCLMLLAGVLRLRCLGAENDDGLDEAIEAARRAVATASPGNALGPMFAGELGVTLFMRFMFSQARPDLDEAVRWLRLAVASPQDSPGKAQYQLQLAGALQAAYEAYGLARDRDEALGLYRHAAESAASPAFRINAARLGADFASDFAPGGAADLLETAVRLLPLAVSRQLSREDQQHALGQFALLSNEAAELALTAGGAGAPARALGLLELSRAVLQGQALDTRRDLLDLQAAHPALASRFLQLRDLLDAPDVMKSGGGMPAVLGSPPAFTRAIRRDGTGVASSNTSGGQPGNSPDRYLAGREFSTLLDQIRLMPGFGSFLLPPPPAELARQAAHGPIVAFNIGRSRCDALIVVPSGVEHVPLPALSVESLVSRLDLWGECLDLIADQDADRDAQSDAEDSLSDVLEWLWDVAAEPVLRHLGYTQPPGPGEPWPRVWWTPGGLLGMLPVHAAGYHRPPGGATVLDRVVSSYTPTVRALSYAREHARTTPSGRSLIVAMPSTPGLDAALPGASSEAEALKFLLPAPTILIEGKDSVTERTPTRDRVLSELAGTGIAHFACHAASHPDDPSYSQIYLHDHRDRPFTVATLIPARLQSAQLAFLSACQTARDENFDLLDEAIHLTSAFQLAGFPHVIGTLWPIRDDVSARIAVDFYRRLGSEPRTLAVADSAQALHDTMRDLRDRHGNSARPSVWAAHIHAGA